MEKQIHFYQTIFGNSPFEDWLENLNDRKARTIIKGRLKRLKLGLLGNCESVGEGVFELKIYYGPGYRIYFGVQNQTLVLLLLGGDKSSQHQDIPKAQIYWQDYQRRTKNE